MPPSMCHESMRTDTGLLSEGKKKKQFYLKLHQAGEWPASALNPNFLVAYKQEFYGANIMNEGYGVMGFVDYVSG